MALFENYERKIDKINAVLEQYGIKDLNEARDVCRESGFDPYQIAREILSLIHISYSLRTE